MSSSILVIDDAISTQQQMFSWLSRSRRRLIFASSCREAMNYLHREQPQLIIFNAEPPDISATELINKLKHRAPQALLLLIVPAGGSTVISTPEYEKHIAQYLIEPLRADVVLITVSRLLKLQQLNRENNYLREELAFSNLASNWHP